MTRDELASLAVGDRIVRTRDDGVEETCTVDELAPGGVWVRWKGDQVGFISFDAHDRIRLEK